MNVNGRWPVAEVVVFLAARIVASAAKGELMLAEDDVAFLVGDLPDAFDWVLATKTAATLLAVVAATLWLGGRCCRCCLRRCRRVTRDQEVQVDLPKENHDITFGASSTRYHTNDQCPFIRNFNQSYVKTLSKCPRCAVLDSCD